ncbi:MAG: hypothetical protein RBS37_06170 [Bacteroidales bacterium]|jgi:hypothetical protein|nr:hypothetical protein [Bacteroidales bacterium]
MRKNEIEKFKPNANPAYTYINTHDGMVLVKIFYETPSEFILEYTMNNTKYSIKLPTIKSKEKQVSAEEINLQGINVSQLEREKLADNINAMLDEIFR